MNFGRILNILHSVLDNLIWPHRIGFESLLNNFTLKILLRKNFRLVQNDYQSRVKAFPKKMYNGSSNMYACTYKIFLTERKSASL